MVHLGNFDASQVEPTHSFDPIPAGKYPAMITASEMKANKAGTGSYLELVFTILEGEYKGRQLWARLNLDNPNETAVKIARAELSAICRAVGVLTPRDSAELHNLPLIVKVGCRHRKDTGEIVNVLKGYEKRDAAVGRPQPALSSTPPWRRQP